MGKLRSIICQNLKDHFTNLITLQGLCALHESSAGLYECGYFVAGSEKKILAAIKVCLSKLRPFALTLAEIPGHTGNMLMSAVGNSYGDIYETHL